MVGLGTIVAVAVALLPSATQPALGAGSCRAESYSVDRLPGACWRPFSSRSPFNRRLPSSPTQVTDSAQIVRSVTSDVGGTELVAGLADTSDDYSHPLYFSSRPNPVFRVHCTEAWGTCPIEGDRVRIPNRARPAAGGDGHLGVIDARRGWEYDLYEVQTKPPGGGQLTVGWGGRTRIGTRRARGLDAGATASGFALSAGVIRPPELRAGLIDHALFMTVVCTNGTSVRPAGPGAGTPCSGKGASSQGAPAMGQHFYLEMTGAQIRALALPRWQKTILTAMAEYGMFVGDTGGNSWGMKVQSGTSYTSLGYGDPWVKLANRIGIPAERASDGSDRFRFDMFDSIDWASRLRVADPCVSRDRC